MKPPVRVNPRATQSSLPDLQEMKRFIALQRSQRITTVTKPLAPKMPRRSSLKTPADTALDHGCNDQTSRRQMLHWMAAGVLVLGSSGSAHADNIADEVIIATSQILGINADDIYLEHNFVEDLGADSLDLVELTMEFESKFNVLIDQEEALRLKTLSDVVYFIKINQ